MRARPLALAGAIAGAALALPAAGEGIFRVDCQEFAAFARHMGYLRSLGASLVAVQAEIAQTPPGAYVKGATAAQLQREARRVWGRRLSRDGAQESAWERCTKALGDLGTDS